MSDFLFEILVEEIPHGVLPGAEVQLQTLLPALLEKHRLSYEGICVFVTPRRLAFQLTGLPSKGASRTIEQKGPSLKAAYDADGKPAPALQGFFKTYNVGEKDIVQREVKGQIYLFIEKTEEGKAVSSILEALTAEVLASLKFTEPMRWNKAGEVHSFIRPVRGVTALLDKEILPLRFFGLDSSRILWGHRQLFPQPVELESSSLYAETLKHIGVIPSLAERKAAIQQQAEACAAPLHAVPALDGELCSILACLTEYPHCLLASFDPAFLNIPKEVLVSEMKVHQKYIPLFDKEGSLMPHYIITANIPCSDSETRDNVLKGNNRVFSARAEDGAFFYAEDLKKGLEHYRGNLRFITFVEGGGSIEDKCRRMEKAAAFLCPHLGLSFPPQSLQCALSYCKADLASLMVGEFPELQGVMGAYYAEAAGFPKDAALAIKEHYYPLGGENPTQELSALVGLADRLDNLCTLTAVGKTVSGSRDPYGLRRQSIALIHILMQFGWTKFSLSACLDGLLPIYQPMLSQSPEEWKRSLTDFIRVRFEGVLRGDPFLCAADTVSAVLAAGFDSILHDAQRAEALQSLRTEQMQALNSLGEIAKRVKNIIKGQGYLELNSALLNEPAEKALWQQIENLEKEFSSLSTKDGFERLLGLEGAVSLFFSAVMVKCGGEQEQARMALLQRLDALFGRLADFSRLS